MAHSELKCDTARYRILIVDDVPEVRSKVRRTVEGLSLDYVEILEAKNENEALEVIRSRYIDLVVLDLFLVETIPSGFELVQAMAFEGCCAKVIMMTHHDTSRHFDEIMRTVTRIDHPQVVNFFRTEELQRALPEALRGLLAEFVRTSIQVTGLDFAAELIHTRRSRYPDERNTLRSSSLEIAAEIERLCRRLFGQTFAPDRTTSVTVRLEPLGRRGLSAAVLLRAVVETRIESDASEANIFECVLKLGPVEDIRTEAARYEEYVRFGVQLVQRVELLGHSYDQAIGGLAYSFAGGVHGDLLVTLDELLRTRPELAGKLMKGLFETVRWYGVSAGVGEIREHLEVSDSKKRISDAIERNMKSLMKLDRQEIGLRFDWGYEREPSVLRIKGASAIKLPGMKFLDAGWGYKEFPRCLVHGDLHGGNVMAELSDNSWHQESDGSADIARVCLIDYRSAGPGPRCIDAVALESSIRIADSEVIASENGFSVRDLAGDALRDAVLQAARRTSSERQFYEAHLLGVRRIVPKAGWTNLASVVTEGVKGSFANETVPVTAEEYLQTALLYIVRQLGYPLDTLVRIRLCAWLGAVYSLSERILKES